MILFNSINFANSWEQILYCLSSAQPFYKQIQMIVISMIVSTVAIGLFKVILLIPSLFVSRKGIVAELLYLIWPAILIGIGVYGLFSIIFSMDIKTNAKVPLYLFANYKCSSIYIINQLLNEVIREFVAIVSAWNISKYCNYFYSSKFLSIIIFACTGICYFGSAGGWNSIITCILLGVVWGIVWYALFYCFYQYNIEILLITLTVVQCLMLIPSVMYCAYPTIVFDSVVGITISLAAVICISKKLQST